MTRARGGPPTLIGVAPWVALLGAAAAWRWVQWSRSAAIFNDGPHFLAAAQAWSEGRASDALAHPQHPLYPIAIAIVHGFGLDWENAGAAVSIAGGVLAIGCAAVFFRDAFGRAVAFLGAALLAVHARAVDFSSDVQSDGLYMGLFAAALAAGWRALDRGSVRWAAAAGLASGLAYLTRPEGLGVAFVVVGCVAAASLAGRFDRREALRLGGAVAVAAALVAMPYVVALSRSGAGMAITQKKTVSAQSGIAHPAPRAAANGAAAAIVAPIPGLPARSDPGEDGRAVDRAATATERAWAALRMEARTARSAFRYGPLALLLVGMFAVRGRPGRRGAFVLAVVGSYTAVLYLLTVQVGYVSRRHALPALLPLFGYAGLGALVLGDWIAQRVHASARGPWVAAALVAAIGIGEVAGQIAPRRAEERAAVAAARWLHASGEPGVLVTDRLRLGYYAGMPYVPFVRADDAALRSSLDRALVTAHGRAGRLYLLLDDADDIAAAQQAAGERLRFLHRVERGGREAWIFELSEPRARE